MLAAAAMQGVIFKTTRLSWIATAPAAYYLTGAWPGEKRPDPDQ